MEYGLLPVEAAISFMLVLLLIYNKKQQFKTSKTILYKYFLYSGLMYGVLLIVGICLLKYTGKNPISVFVWRSQGMTLFATWIMFYFYCLTTVYDINETKFFKIISSKLEFKLISLFLIIYLIAIFMPFYISLFDNIDVNNIEIFTKDSSTTILILLIISSISLFSRIISRRNKLSKEFIFSTMFGCLICSAVCVFHLFYHANTFLPLVFVVFAYVLYFFVENPDILLLQETVKLQNSTNIGQNHLDFFGGLDNSINNPIDNILLTCNNVKNSKYSYTKEEVDSILNNSNELLDKLSSIFDSSVIRNEVSLNNKNYEVSDLIHEITEVLKEKIGNKKLRLCLNFSPNLSSKLRGDYDKISQICSLLISNACSNTTFGKIMVTLMSNKNGNKELLTFKIMDTGEGLSLDDQKNFYTDIDKCSAYLKQTKNLVNKLGGKFWFKSTERIGCTYFVQFEQNIVDGSPIGNTLGKKSVISNGPVDYSKFKLLIVDDDEMSLKLSEKIFKKFGFKVSLSSNGSDCINKIKSNEKYDMIFMDIMMSDFNGVETLKAIRVLEDYEIPPVVAFTANALAGVKEDYLNEGFDDYLEKPLVYKELSRVLNKYFNE